MLIDDFIDFMIGKWNPTLARYKDGSNKLGIILFIAFY